MIGAWTIWVCPQCGATPRPFDCNHDRPPMPHGRHEMVKVEVVPAERVKELEDKLNEACDYIPRWFIDKHDLRPRHLDET